MAVITISSGLCGKGKQVAKRLSEKLSYRVISREVLLEASEHFNIPEIKLTRAIDNAPSILDRFFYGKEKYIAYIKEAILSRLADDNVVYHGMAGHFFVQGIPHVLKVLVVSDIEDRIAEEVSQHDVTPREARRLIEKDDDERQAWGYHLYGLDTRDPNLYDLTVNLKNTSLDEAVDVILQAVKLPGFQTTDKSKSELANKALEARLYARVVDKHPTAKVSITDGTAHISVETGNFLNSNTVSSIETLLADFKNKLEVKVNVVPILEAG